MTQAALSCNIKKNCTNSAMQADPNRAISETCRWNAQELKKAIDNSKTQQVISLVLRTYLRQNNFLTAPVLEQQQQQYAVDDS